MIEAFCKNSSKYNQYNRQHGEEIGSFHMKDFLLSLLCWSKLIVIPDFILKRCEFASIQNPKFSNLLHDISMYNVWCHRDKYSCITKHPYKSVNQCRYVNIPCVTPVNDFHTPAVYLHALDPNVHDRQLPTDPTSICKSHINGFLQHRVPRHNITCGIDWQEMGDIRILLLNLYRCKIEDFSTQHITDYLRYCHKHKIKIKILCKWHLCLCPNS